MLYRLLKILLTPNQQSLRFFNLPLTTAHVLYNFPVNRSMLDSQSFFLRNIWYFAMPGATLKRGQLLAKTLLGEPILFGRTGDGHPFAIRDICPHRGIPLRFGRFDGSEVECCYHGWRFNATGACTLIPSLAEGQELNLDLFGVKSYPVQEVQGNIWIYMTTSDSPTNQVPRLEVPQVPGFSDRSPQLAETLRFPCFVDHAIVGLMDPAHGPFVHRVWWWRSNAPLYEKSKTFDPSPSGFTMRRHHLLRTSFFYRLLGGSPEVEIQFQLPGVRIEQVITPAHRVCNLTTVTPISDTETEITTQFYWTVPWLTVVSPVLRPFVRAFLRQDGDVVVKQKLGLDYNPSLMLIKDADTQARWYYQIKAEYARAQTENRPFVNPIQSQVLRWKS